MAERGIKHVSLYLSQCKARSFLTFTEFFFISYFFLSVPEHIICLELPHLQACVVVMMTAKLILCVHHHHFLTVPTCIICLLYMYICDHGLLSDEL